MRLIMVLMSKIQKMSSVSLKLRELSGMVRAIFVTLLLVFLVIKNQVIRFSIGFILF